MRYTNSFNTNNPAGDMKPLFLDAYEALHVLSHAMMEASNFSTPVFIGEYHSTHVDTKKETLNDSLQSFAELSRAPGPEGSHGPGYKEQLPGHGLNLLRGLTPCEVGVSFFEFQVRYDKGGSEMLFGMSATSKLLAALSGLRFGLGAQEITTMRFFGVEFPVWPPPRAALFEL